MASDDDDDDVISNGSGVSKCISDVLSIHEIESDDDNEEISVEKEVELDANIASPSDVSLRSYKGHLRTSTSSSGPYSPEYDRAPYGKLVARAPANEPMHGNRIVCIDLLREHLLPHLCCPTWRRVCGMQHLCNWSPAPQTPSL